MHVTSYSLLFQKLPSNLNPSGTQMKYINAPLILLCIKLVQSFVFGSSIADALVLTALTALYGFYYYQELKAEPVANKELINRIVILEQEIIKQRDKVSNITLSNALKR